MENIPPLVHDTLYDWVDVASDRSIQTLYIT